MPSISCAVVGTTGSSLVTVDVPPTATVREVAVLVKARSPQTFQDVPPSKIRMFRTGPPGSSISSASFELGLLPDFLEAGEYKWASEYILSDWDELHHEEIVGSALPSAMGEDQATVVQVVALVPVRKVSCACGHDVFRVSINESAAVGELKAEIHNRMAGMFKIVNAKTRHSQLQRGEVTGRHTLQVANFLRALAASDEIDPLRSVRAVFGDRGNRESVDVLIVPYNIVI